MSERINVGDTVLCIKDTFEYRKDSSLPPVRIVNIKYGEEYIVTSVHLCECKAISLTLKGVVVTNNPSDSGTSVKLYCNCGVSEVTQVGQIVKLGVNRFVKPMSNEAFAEIEEVLQIKNEV